MANRNRNRMLVTPMLLYSLFIIFSNGYYFLQNKLTFKAARSDIFNVVVSSLGEDITTKSQVESSCDEDMHRESTSFSKYIKRKAALRQRLRPIEKKQLASDFTNFALTLDSLSFCDGLWSLGKLGCSMKDFENCTVTFSQVLAKVSSVDDDVSILKVIIGLHDLGVPWKAFPSDLKKRYMTAVLSANDSRVLSNGIYLLSKLNLTKADVPINFIPQVNKVILEHVDSFSSQGLANTMHGLSKFGVHWVSDIDPLVGTRFIERLQSLQDTISSSELGSILLSLASMQVKLQDNANDDNIVDNSLFNSPKDLSPIVVLIEALLISQNEGRRLLSAPNRELANILWAIGEMRFPFRLASREFQSLILQCASVILRRDGLTHFDLETVINALASMELKFPSLSEPLHQLLMGRIREICPTMNAICAVNVIVALGQMGLNSLDDVSAGSAGSGDAAEGSSSMRVTATDVGCSLSSWAELQVPLLRCASDRLHAVNPIRYGEIMLSLSTLGYRYEATEENHTSISGLAIPNDVAERVKAVLSRAILSFPCRSAVYSILALGRMGFAWPDLQKESVTRDRTVEPLAGRIDRYLLKKTSSLKEHEYAVLLEGLSLLQVNWATDLSPEVVAKLMHRIIRVVPHITPANLLRVIRGLTSSGISWVNFSEESREALRGAVGNLLVPASADEFLGSKPHYMLPAGRVQVNYDEQILERIYFSWNILSLSA